jgi:hypothetical protein
MFDIGDLGTNETVYVLELELDAEGKAKAGIQLLGLDSAAVREAERTIATTALKKGAIRGRTLDMKNEADATELVEDREERDIAKLVAATVGWFGLTSGKKEFEFSKENAAALYKANSHVRNLAMDAVAAGANFLKR